MTDLRKAAEMAFTELCNQRDAHYTKDIPTELTQAINALRKALAQSEQEPVATVVKRQYEDGTYAGNTLDWTGRNSEDDFPVGTKLYTDPQPVKFNCTVVDDDHPNGVPLSQWGQQPEQEPFEYWNAVEGWVKIDEVQQHFDSVGCGTIYKTSGENRVPLYKTPPSIEAAVLAEREACARVCDAESQRAIWNWENDILKNQTFWNGGDQLASSCAAAIRARGER